MELVRFPDCPIDELRNFFDSIGWTKMEEHCTNKNEIWRSPDDLIGNFDFANFPCDSDRVPFGACIMAIEHQAHKKMYEVPYYNKQFKQRISD